MPEFLDYDPVTGVTHWFDYDDETHLSHITTTQDLAPLVEHTKALARSGATDKGIKESWWLYAKLPAVVQVELHKAGIKMSDPGATKRIVQYINEHYPYLKCTEKQDAGIAPKIYLPKSVNAD